MPRIKIGRNIATKARERSNLTAEEREAVDKLLDAQKALSADVKDLPLAYLKALLDDTRLGAQQRSVIAMRIFGMSGSTDLLNEVYDTVVHSAMEFGSLFKSIDSGTPNCEFFLNGRWYPIALHAEIRKGNDEYKFVSLQGTLSICETQEHLWFPVSSSLFATEGGDTRERRVIDVLREFGLRGLQATPADFNLKLLNAERWATKASKMAVVKGPAMARREYWWACHFESRTLGSPEAPSKVIVEPHLEVSENDRGYLGPHGQHQEGTSRLPFVRAYSLDLKEFVYVDVDDIEEYAFDEQAMQRLHLPGEMLEILSKVFNTSVEALFGDLIDGKHGGMVILACGGPGVGKTLTAEIYAEHTQRPLYVLELGELGTDLNRVEENLRRIFARVARWNAVLQFDECEIFLAARGDDLERSAIVGVFLRLLDYYRGILFLTTNRPQVLDPAVLSRVTLRLDYPDLDSASRARIWQSMFAAAGLELEGGDFAELAEYNINGRQIRNLTRLTKIMYPDGTLSLDDMDKLIRYTAVPLQTESAELVSSRAPTESHRNDAHRADVLKP